MTGTVARWNDERGFGFIDADGDESGRGMFVHRTAIQAGPQTKDARGVKRFYLVEGGQVKFDTAPGKEGKGPQAINVRVI